MITNETLCLIQPEQREVIEAASWQLQQKEKRHIALVGSPEEIETLRSFLSEDASVDCYPVHHLLHWELILRTIAWKAVWQKLEARGEPAFVERVLLFHRAAGLLLLDSSDWGIKPLDNWMRRERRELRNGLALEASFPDCPAIILGAGPSLLRNKKELVRLREQALLLCGGNALAAIPLEPHFAGMIDPTAPYREMKRYSFGETPFCFQSRISSDNFSLIHGEALWFPEGHHLFLNWLDGQEEEFQGGWSITTFLTRIAWMMGCNPIILVGAELCYEEGKKYPHQCDDSSSQEKIVTQEDWLMARHWFEEFALQHPERRWIDAREGGLPLRGFEEIPLKKLTFPHRAQLQKEVHEKIHSLPRFSPPPQRWEEWLQSLRRVQKKIAQGEEDLANEIVHKKLLDPLWQTWHPFITREMGEKKLPFFQHVIQEHLHAAHLS
ncbi:MAG: DUF115 domain-containing protein [Verrucomicrobiota bacterium]|nr:DUF115 domain-containing protein [Verrucomicrobiota bacterium]